MDAPITERESLEALKKMKGGKATGRDGFPSEFYRTFCSSLLKPLLKTCNYVLAEGMMPATWSEARIIVIPKPGKDTQKVESYRPISLINHDAKLFASVLG